MVNYEIDNTEIRRLSDIPDKIRHNKKTKIIFRKISEKKSRKCSQNGIKLQTTN